MSSANSKWALLLPALVLLGAYCNALTEDYYSSSCPSVSKIVRKKVHEILRRDRNLAGAFNRMQFHDCWVRGCDASILLEGSGSERDGNVNFLIRGFDEIEEIKSALESECPGVVSCADIIALASRDATAKVGGPSWTVTLGRKDGFTSSATEADDNLPFPVLTFDQLVDNFARKGFSAREMVVLSGAHTVGRTHCNGIAPNLYNYTGIDDLTNPTLDTTFADSLKSQCPKGNRDNIVDMDDSKNVFDNNYFVQVQSNKGRFITDTELVQTDTGRSVVSELVNSGFTFSSEFGAAMAKMETLDVLLGSEGQVRKTCKFNN